MHLQKQPVQLNFAQGINTKADPNQLPIGQFLALNNSVFTTQGRLSKRNGFANITTLPNSEQTTLTTLNDNLIATGSNLYAFSEDTSQWLNQGTVQPISLNTSPLVRVSTNQTAPDAQVASNGLVCLVYVDTAIAYYQVSDSATGQQIVPRTALGSTAKNPRVFILGQYFIITFMQTVTATTHLRYIAIPIDMPTSPNTVADISTNVLAIGTGYDAAVANNSLYLGWSGSGTTIKLRYLSSTLVVSAETSVAGHTSTYMSVTADNSASTPIIWFTFYRASDMTLYTMAYSQSLTAQVLAPTLIDTITPNGINALTSIATNQLMTAFYDCQNTYTYDSNLQTDFIKKNTVTQAGVVGTPSVMLRSVGLASKAFYNAAGSIYMLVAFDNFNISGNITASNQRGYFLSDSNGNIFMRLAYSNGGGYVTTQVLPNVSYNDSLYYIPYLANDFLASVNKGTNLTSGTPTAAIYTQQGVNLAAIGINNSGQHSSEIAGALHLTGGQLWEYDGVRPVEHGFQVYPEDPEATTSGAGGNLADLLYFYVFTYEWTDNQGNLHRSAPSIPLRVDLSGSVTGTNSVVLHVPTLRMTYKVSPNPVRIVGYRWSTAQQIYYQFTSLTSPTANDTTVDSVNITDTLADSSILGDVQLYTNGGVIENIAAPASTVSCLFKNRLFIVDAEDQNLLWFSKQVIESTPVEMSDLFTIYVAPTTGAQGSTGPITALSAMDDKLIIFKKDAIYYLTGTGPDNTGASSDFSDPIYISSSVGCANQNSIVLMPSGIMFQSDKGIWLLGRDLSTQYIGSQVESFNSQQVESALTIPGTNQVRFTLGNNITLMYDYFYNQWGTFSNISAVSATLYQGLHTYLNSFGAVYQEAANTYVDGSIPVLMSFTTAWLNVAGIRGYERFYFGFLLGTYVTPFKLNIGFSYDYSTPIKQQIVVTPDNFTPAWGGESVWGGAGGWGGDTSNIFQARIFPQQQKCQTFQLTINELYDGSFGVSPGQGLTLSGMNLVVGVKKGYSIQKASRSFG